VVASRVLAASGGDRYEEVCAGALSLLVLLAETTIDAPV